MKMPLALPLLVAIALLASCGGSSKQAPTATPTDTAISAVSPTPTATLTPSPTPPPGPSTVDGLPVQELTLGDEVPLPPNLVVYYATGGYGKDGGNSDLERAYRDESGTLHIDDLYTGLRKLGPVYSEVFDPETGLGAVAVCTRPACGLYPETAGSLGELFTTDDGGITWTDRGPLPRDTFVMSYDGVTVMVFHFSLEKQGPLTYYPYPSEELAKEAPSNAWPMFYEGAGVVWNLTLEAPRGVDIRLADGTLVFHDSTRPENLDSARPLGSAVGQPFRFRSWVGEFVTEGIARFYIEDTNDAAEPLAVYRWTGESLHANVQVAPQLLLGGVLMPGPQSGVFPAALIDLGTRVIHPIARLAPQNMGVFVRSALVGPVLRVKPANADCLPVRAQPSESSPLKACYKDGVLLRPVPPPTDTFGGEDWRALLLPGRELGWIPKATFEALR